MLPEVRISKTRNACWWGGFLVPAIILQRLFPGVDFLLAGLLLTLQERRYADLLWVLPLLVILQEGMGTREFGVVLLWYVVVAFVFSLGRWFFDADNFLYVFLFSGCLAACYFAVVFLMSPLYAVSVDVDRLRDESLHLALLLPVCWKLAQVTRRWFYAGNAE
ncbi:MAG: hypothetical protein LBC79_10410 [Deltaproteobacteria bacterium]|jgi:hypothetical protein|nr:hypothetical protein [Deltaproteobacteria bacterium]